MKKKLLALVLVLALAFSSLAMLAGCSSKLDEVVDKLPPEIEALIPTDYTGGDTLVVGYSPFSQKFSTFFAKTAYDQDVAGMTGLALLVNTRGGSIVLKGIDGEKESYNGTEYTYYGPANCEVTIGEKDANGKRPTTYSFTLRDDLFFSDGTHVTIDDVIFSLYVVSDPTYTGSSTLYSQPILGMNEYRTGVKADIAAKYEALADALHASSSDNADFTNWTKEQQDSYFGECLTNAGIKFAQEIIDYVGNSYAAYADAGYAGDYTGKDLAQNEAVQVAFGMRMWGFGKFTGKTFTDALGTTYDMTSKVPTVADYWANIFGAYEGDLDAIEAETAGSALADLIKSEFVRIEGPKDAESGGEITNISGIVKTGTYSMTVTTTDFDATTIYHLGVTIAPLHYYGSRELYKYTENKFGFPKGDLSLIESKTTTPMGAGAYKFVKYEGGIVYFERNPYYYKGCPKITYLRFKETTDTLKTSGVVGGDIDVTDPSISNSVVGQIKESNSNGELSGNVIYTSLVDNLGYGYIGINSKNVNVGGEQASAASKNYRKGLATLISVYRDVVINSYYGDRAVVIQYPISNTSWAAPSPADSGYRTAYSLDVSGNQIYSTTMTADEKYDAAKKAAIGFFKAAGFTFDEATGKFTAAPNGASLSITMDIPADGTGDHPSFAIFTYFESAMEALGFDITIIDYANSSAFWDKLEANNMQIWAAAWGATMDPDMYQVYHSSNGIGLGGTDSNHYNIADADLDTKIMEARSSSDTSYRKAIYKECLEIIMDWGVEIPTYQRKNCIILSEERIKMSTVTPDITTFWGWASELETLEMN